MNNFEDLQSIANNLNSLCRQANLATPTLPPVKPAQKKRGPVANPFYDEQLAARDNMRLKRAEQKDIKIDFSNQSMERRAIGDEYPDRFLRMYFPNIFYLEFCPNQLHNIKELDIRMKIGGTKAIADMRGGGKTSIAKGMIIRGLVYRYIKWVPWVECNSDMAIDSLEDMKLMFENPKGDDLFGKDFPEYCIPIRVLEGEAQRARGQTFAMKRTLMKVQSKRLILPTIDPQDTPNGTGAYGGIIQAFGAEKPIRGLVREGIRPDMVSINDIETEETAKSLTMTATIMRNITNAIQGLGGPGEKLGVMLLGTILRKGCVADQLTDRSKYPQWQGERMQMLPQQPINMDMWTKYIDIRQREQRDKKVDCRKADEFYQKNQEEMDAGAKVANPLRYESGPGLDGQPKETSAIQSCFNIICDKKMDYFLCECQNDPPESISDVYEIENHIIEGKINGLDQGVIPAWAEKVTVCVDVHDTKLYWTALATKQGFNGYVFDYGVERVFSPISGSTTKKERQKQVDIAIIEALTEFDKKIRPGWRVENSDVRKTKDIGLADAGYKDTAVYKFVRRCPGWLPAKGGASRSGNYTIPKPSATIKNIGDGFHFSYIEAKRIWLLIVDPNKWKKHVQDSFLVSDIEADGSLSLFGDDPVKHKAFAEHIVSEAYNTEKQKFEPVKGLRHNHWLDSTSGCCVAAAVIGIQLLITDVLIEENDEVVNEVNGIRTKY